MTLQDKDTKYRLNFFMNTEANFLSLSIANQSRKYKLNVMNERDFSKKARLFQKLKTSQHNLPYEMINIYLSLAT